MMVQFYFLLWCLIKYSGCYLPVVVLSSELDVDGEAEFGCKVLKEYHADAECTIIRPFSIFPPTYFKPIWDQVDIYLDKVKPLFLKNPNGIHLLTASLDTLVARGILQSYANHTVKNFIHISGPMNGVYGLTGLVPSFVQDFAKPYVTNLLYNSVLQTTFSIANLWHDPRFPDDFLRKNIFLPKLNNLIKHENNERFKRNFLKIDKLIMLAGTKDQIVMPWQSNIGGYYDQRFKIVELKDQKIYTQDTFGLKTLDKRGDLIIHVDKDASHTTFTSDRSRIVKYVLPYAT